MNTKFSKYLKTNHLCETFTHNLPINENFKVGDRVTWHYRSAIGHGTIEARDGGDDSNPRWKIAQHDDHVSAEGKHEPKFVHHYSDSLKHAN